MWEQWAECGEGRGFVWMGGGKEWREGSEGGGGIVLVAGRGLRCRFKADLPWCILQTQPQQQQRSSDARCLQP